MMSVSKNQKVEMISPQSPGELDPRLYCWFCGESDKTDFKVAISYFQFLVYVQYELSHFQFTIYMVSMSLRDIDHSAVNTLKRPYVFLDIRKPQESRSWKHDNSLTCQRRAPESNWKPSKELFSNLRKRSISSRKHDKEILVFPRGESFPAGW